MNSSIAARLRAARPICVVSLGLLSCSSADRTATVQINGQTAEVRTLEVTARFAGTSLAVPTAPAGPAPLVLALPKDTSGQLDLQIEALRDDLCVVARGGASAWVESGQRVSLTLDLAAEPTPDCRRRGDASSPRDAALAQDLAMSLDAAGARDAAGVDASLPKCGPMVTACGPWARTAPNKDLGCGAVVLCTPDPAVCTKGRAPAHDILQTEGRTCTDTATGSPCQQISTLVTQGCFAPGCPC